MMIVGPLIILVVGFYLLEVKLRGLQPLDNVAARVCGCSVRRTGSLKDQQKLLPEQKKGLNNCEPYLTRDLAPPSNYSEAKKPLATIDFWVGRDSL